MTKCWRYAVRSSNICAKLLVSVPWYLQSARSEKKKILRKLLALIDLYEGLWWVGARFRRLRQSYITGPEQKKWPCRALPQFMAVSMVPNILHEAFVGGIISVV